MGFMSARIVHLHPSRFCNLACRHCYSASGPTVRKHVELAHVLAALRVLRREGYEVLSLSGGEPLLYPELPELLPAAVAMGFRVNLVTNGAPVGGTLLGAIKQFVNVVAISLDGSPATHNELRADPRAFEYVRRAIDRLSGIDKQFCLAMCVSCKSLEDVPWAFEFGEQHGAAAIQFHPFAPVGRGRALAAELELSPADRARLFILAELLNSEKLLVQCDLAPVDVALQRMRDYVLMSRKDISDTPLAELVNPLVIDDRGCLLPFAFGLNEAFSLGNIAGDFEDQICRGRESGFKPLADLLTAAFESVRVRGESFVDWFYEIVATSYAQHGGRKSKDALAERLLSRGIQHRLPLR